MVAITFDTLKFANKLKAAGATSEYAEAEAAALSEVFETNLKELVTKDDLKCELADIKAEQKVMKWMLGAILALLVSIALKLFLY